MSHEGPVQGGPWPQSQQRPYSLKAGYLLRRLYYVDEYRKHQARAASRSGVQVPWRSANHHRAAEPGPASTMPTTAGHDPEHWRWFSGPKGLNGISMPGPWIEHIRFRRWVACRGGPHSPAWPSPQRTWTCCPMSFCLCANDHVCAEYSARRLDDDLCVVDGPRLEIGPRLRVGGCAARSTLLMFATTERSGRAALPLPPTGRRPHRLEPVRWR